MTERIVETERLGSIQTRLVNGTATLWDFVVDGQQLKENQAEGRPATPLATYLVRASAERARR